MAEIPPSLALSPKEWESDHQAKTSSIHRLRLSQDFPNMSDVTKVITTVTLGKPKDQVFFRVHTEWEALYRVLELKQGFKSEFFLVDIEAVPELDSEVSVRRLVPLITRDGTLYIYPLRIATHEKKLDLAGLSAQAAMQQAKTSWVRMKWNGREFEVFVAKGQHEPPLWPETTYEQLLELAFDGRVIDTPEHWAVKALNGGA
jgi:hypothetical protein